MRISDPHPQPSADPEESWWQINELIIGNENKEKYWKVCQPTDKYPLFTRLAGISWRAKESCPPEIITTMVDQCSLVNDGCSASETPKTMGEFGHQAESSNRSLKVVFAGG